MNPGLGKGAQSGQPTPSCTNAKPGKTPPRPLSRAEIRAGLRISNWEAVASTIHSTLVSGTFLTGFAIAWGADDFQIGLLAALTFLATPFQWLGAWLVDRAPGHRRELVAWFCLFARAPMALIALFPLIFDGTAKYAVSLALLLLMLQRAAANLQEPGWFSWMADLVPPWIRGRYMGIRGSLTEAISISGMLIAGFAIDYFQTQGHAREGFAWLQCGAAIAGVCSFALLLRQPDPGHRPPPPQGGIGSLLRMLVEHRFRWLVAFNGLWLAGLNFCAPFFTVHLIKNFGWDFRQLAILSVVGSVAAILANPLWGRIADQYGHKWVLKICWLGMMSVPVFYILCPAGYQWPIFLASLVNGIFLAGFSLTMFSLTLAGLPIEARASGSALLNFVAGPASFLALLASGALANHLAASEWKLWGLTIGSYQLLFALSIVMRIPSWALLGGIEESHSGSEEKKNLS